MEDFVSAFKHRVWFIRHVIRVSSHRPQHIQRVLWLDMVQGGDADIWLWNDDADEQHIQSLNLRRLFQWDTQLQDLDDVSRRLALRMRADRRPPKLKTSLAHVSPHQRIRLIAWFIVAAMARKGDTAEALISRWGDVFPRAQLAWAPGRASCHHHSAIAHVLPMWVKTMSEVYQREDIHSIPWSVPCNCLEHTLAIGSPRQLREPNPAALPFIYEIVVPPWLVILWVAFRAFRGRQLDAFLDLLQEPDNRDIVFWEPKDASYLFQLLASCNNPSSEGWSLYSAWRYHMFELSLKEWSSICAMTRVESRVRASSQAADTFFGLKCRLCAFLLLLSPDNFVLPIEIFAPLGFQADEEPFRLVSQIVNERGELGVNVDFMDSWMAPSPSPLGGTPAARPEGPQVAADFGSIDFWTVPKLERWLGKHGNQVCFAALPKPGASLLKWVEYLPIVAQCNLSQHLLVYTLATLLQRSASEQELEAFRQAATDWANQTEFQCLLAYQSFVRTMVDFLKRTYGEERSVDFHSISTQVCARLKDDIFIVTARLVRLFGYQDLRRQFLAFREADAQTLLDLLQNILDHNLNQSVVRPLLFEALSRLSNDSGLHPTCFELSGLQKIGHQVAAGGFGDVWKGVIGGQIVCVKMMRLFKESDVQALLKEFRREALIWRQLCHANLLPFYGLYYLESRLCIISPWMENGNILDYVKSTKPGAERCLSWILDVALGVEYLHKNRIVHGDLKAINILVTASHRACIVDLGLSALGESIALRFTQTAASTRGGTARYQAPELLKSEKQNHYGSDVYAFAHVCYEILTGKIPFHEILNDAAVMFKILGGSRPERLVSCRGSQVLDALWDLLQNCWEEDFNKRPKIEDIVLKLVGPSIKASNTQSNTDWDERFSSKFRRSLADSLLPSVARMEGLLFGDREGCKVCFPVVEPLSTREPSKRKYQPGSPVENQQPVSKARRITTIQQGMAGLIRRNGILLPS